MVDASIVRAHPPEWPECPRGMLLARGPHGVRPRQGRRSMAVRWLPRAAGGLFSSVSKQAYSLIAGAPPPRARASLPAKGSPHLRIAAQCLVCRQTIALRARAAPPGPGSTVQDGYKGKSFQPSHPRWPSLQVRGPRPILLVQNTLETPSKRPSGGGAGLHVGGMPVRERRDSVPIHQYGTAEHFRRILPVVFGLFGTLLRVRSQVVG